MAPKLLTESGMKLLKAITRNPEAVAIAAICLLLGPGKDLVRFERSNRGERVRIGVYQRLDAPPARLHLQKL